MKKNMRNALAISGMAIILGTSGIVFDANANTLEGKNFRHERNFRGKNFPKIHLSQRHRKGFSGTVTSISPDSLTMTTRGTKSFKVNKTDNTRIFNKTWKNIDFSTIKTGDKIVVHGTLTDKTVSARTIRDLSI